MVRDEGTAAPQAAIDGVPGGGRLRGDRRLGGMHSQGRVLIYGTARGGC
jgi:hypothetical protein